jgi:hypothetical protein
MANSRGVVNFGNISICQSEKGPITIEAMWEQKNADAAGFEALKVAAFRSVGIPAQLDTDHRAELFNNQKWEPAL